MLLMRSLALSFVRGVLGLALVAGLAGCDWGVEPAERESLVVEAFLETGQPLPPIVLRRTRPLGSPQAPQAEAASGAQVRLSLNGETVSYDEDPRQPGRYVPTTSSDSIRARVPWSLTIEWNGERAEVQGRTPPPIRTTEVCVTVPEEPVRAVRVDSLRRDSLDIPTERGFIYPIDVTVRWTPSGLTAGADTTQWVRAQLRPDTSQFTSRLVDRFLQPAEVRREDRFGRADVTGDRQWTGVYAVPVDSSTAPLPRHRLTTTVVRGDSSFGDFARSRTDPDLREPISNVEGALGVAAAVAIDSLVHVVTPETDGCVGPSPDQRIQSGRPSYNDTDLLINRIRGHGRDR